MQPLYNREGRAVAYIADNESSIYLYDGGPAAWIHQGCVYAYSGRFLGWLMYGWLCDAEGHPAFFTDRSQGGPRRPARQPRPTRAPREFRPQRAQRWGRPSRPGMKLEWSKLSDEGFFARAPGEELVEATEDGARGEAAAVTPPAPAGPQGESPAESAAPDPATGPPAGAPIAAASTEPARAEGDVDPRVAARGATTAAAEVETSATASDGAPSPARRSGEE